MKPEELFQYYMQKAKGSGASDLHSKRLMKLLQLTEETKKYDLNTVRDRHLEHIALDLANLSRDWQAIRAF